MKRKDTHTLQQVETYCYELVNKIRDAETIEEQKALLKKLKRSEQFCNDLHTKETNGKAYPDRMYHSDDKPMNKEEIIELIKSVNIPKDKEYEKSKMDMELRGIFVTKE